MVYWFRKRFEWIVVLRFQEPMCLMLAWFIDGVSVKLPGYVNRELSAERTFLRGADGR